MWILQKQVLVGGIVVWSYYSETVAADINHDPSEAKFFESEEQAIIFRDSVKSMADWVPVQYDDPTKGNLTPWGL